LIVLAGEMLGARAGIARAVMNGGQPRVSGSTLRAP
jgi:hypothetical protein